MTLKSLKIKGILFGVLAAALCAALAAPTTAGGFPQEKSTKSAETPDYVDEYAGIKFTKPSPDWQVINSGPELVQRIICLPPGASLSRFVSRFVILIYPTAAIPGGMEFRRQQVGNVAAEAKVEFHQVEFVKGTIGGKECTVFTYDLASTPPLKTTEYGLANQGNYYVIQAFATQEDWAKPEIAEAFDKCFKSVAFVRIPTTKEK